MSFKNLIENEIISLENDEITEGHYTFKKGDKVVLTLKGLQKFNNKGDPGAGRTKEQIDFSSKLAKIYDKKIVGEVERVFPGSNNMNVEFDGVLYHIEPYMVELHNSLKEGVQETKELTVYMKDHFHNDIMKAVKVMKERLMSDNFKRNTMLSVFDEIASRAADKYEKEYGTKGDNIFSLLDIRHAGEEVLTHWLKEWDKNELKDVK